ncbi:MAG: hypothetical protein SGARI_002450, partial [Bacillariaceae sp.]
MRRNNRYSPSHQQQPQVFFTMFSFVFVVAFCQVTTSLSLLIPTTQAFSPKSTQSRRSLTPPQLLTPLRHRETLTSSRLFLLENSSKAAASSETPEDVASLSPSPPENQTAKLAPEYLSPQSTSSASTSTSSSTSSIRQFVKDKIFLGIDPSPDVVAIATIYFVEGALGLARLAQTYLLKDELHLGPAELSALTGIFSLPWTIKPLYGFLSDGFPLFGYRRRSYLILAGLTGCFSYSLVGNRFWGLFDTIDHPEAVIPGTVAALVLSSACIAFSDVVADGIVVQKTRDSNYPKIAGGLQSLCWGSAAI